MKSCGKRFHDEVGKFRFLNELIKVVSPKVGARSPSSGLHCRLGELGREDPCSAPVRSLAQTLHSEVRGSVGSGTEASRPPAGRRLWTCSQMGLPRLGEG